MSATSTMETANTPVPTLMEPLAALVLLAMNWTAMDSTALVITLGKTIRVEFGG